MHTNNMGSSAASHSNRMLNDKKLRQFHELYRTVRFKKDEIIFLANTEPTCAYAIKSGFVRSFTYTDTDDERSISFVLRNEMLPVAWLYFKSNTALFNYVAHTDCELFRIKRDSYHNSLANEPEYAQTMLVHSMNDNVTKMLEIQALEQTTAERKILYTLNNFCISYGKPILQNQVIIQVPLTQRDIAGFTGLTRETVTNIIVKLKRRQVISVKRRFYTIDTVKLREHFDPEAEIPNLN
jgi:CRP/FNR family transcriptional regulator, anaerobic regulatory protein